MLLTIFGRVWGVVLLVLAASFAQAAQIDWTAYNDCIGTTLGSPHTTLFSDYRENEGGAPTSGQLVNYATGSSVGMPSVTFTIPQDVVLQPRVRYEYGTALPPGTDAFMLFDGKVDFTGTIIEHSDQPGWFVEIRF